MDAVYEKLRAVNHRGLATKAGVDRAQFKRLLEENVYPSPKLIGRIAAALDQAVGDELIGLYLRTIADQVDDHREAQSKTILQSDARRRKAANSAF